MKVLALDYGKKRVGLALSDPLGIIAQPYLTLEVKTQVKLIKRLKCIIDENGIGLVLIGHPISLRGGATKMSAEIVRFARLLAKAAGVEVRLWDERYTTRYAARRCQDLGIKTGPGDYDRIAAAIILEEYLQSSDATPA
jgi:putative Holliday junction resolvase